MLTEAAVRDVWRSTMRASLSTPEVSSRRGDTSCPGAVVKSMSTTKGASSAVADLMCRWMQASASDVLSATIPSDTPGATDSKASGALSMPVSAMLKCALASGGVARRPSTMRMWPSAPALGVSAAVLCIDRTGSIRAMSVKR